MIYEFSILSIRLRPGWGGAIRGGLPGARGVPEVSGSLGSRVRFGEGALCFQQVVGIDVHFFFFEIEPETECVAEWGRNRPVQGRSGGRSGGRWLPKCRVCLGSRVRIGRAPCVFNGLVGSFRIFAQIQV